MRPVVPGEEEWDTDINPTEYSFHERGFIHEPFFSFIFFMTKHFSDFYMDCYYDVASQYFHQGSNQGNRSLPTLPTVLWDPLCFAAF